MKLERLGIRISPELAAVIRAACPPGMHLAEFVETCLRHSPAVRMERQRAGIVWSPRQKRGRPRGTK